MSGYPGLADVLARRAAAATAAAKLHAGAHGLEGGAYGVPGAGSASSVNTGLIIAAVMGMLAIVATAIIVPMVLMRRSDAPSSSSSSSSTSASSAGSASTSGGSSSGSSSSSNIPIPAPIPTSATSWTLTAPPPLPAPMPAPMPTITTYSVYNMPVDERPPYYAPSNRWDPVERQLDPQPRDEPRWPPAPFHADNGFYGYGQYGPGGYGPDGVWYKPGQLAGALPSAFADYDYPTAAIMGRNTRERGPWERYGALVSSVTSTTTDSVLPLFGRVNGRWQDRYDYRTVVNKVPVELTSADRGVEWINSGDGVTVPGLGTYTAQIYVEYR